MELTNLETVLLPIYCGEGKTEEDLTAEDFNELRGAATAIQAAIMLLNTGNCTKEEMKESLDKRFGLGGSDYAFTDDEINTLIQADAQQREMLSET
jgi:hypothetical protein